MSKDDQYGSSSIAVLKTGETLCALGKEKPNPAPIEVRFGARVHNLRVERRMPQDLLASRAQLHRNYISEMERGKRNVSLRVIERIAMALDVEVMELFHGKEYG